MQPGQVSATEEATLSQAGQPVSETGLGSKDSRAEISTWGSSTVLRR